MTLPVDAPAWCAMRYGAGSEFVESVSAFGLSWDRAPGGRLAYQDLNGICQTMAGRTFNSAQAGVRAATDAEGRFLCTGRVVGVHSAAAADARLRTYPDLAAYDPKAAPAGSTVNVVAPLEWTGDASAMCNGVDLDLVIGLQTVPADALIACRWARAEPGRPLGVSILETAGVAGRSDAPRPIEASGRGPRRRRALRLAWKRRTAGFERMMQSWRPAASAQPRPEAFAALRSCNRLDLVV